MARSTDERGGALGGLILAPCMAAILAGAGALLLAMILAAVTGEYAALRRAAGVLLVGALRWGLGLGLAAAVLGGLVTLLFDRASAIPIGALVGFLVGCGGALTTVVLAAHVASPTGTLIGGIIGGLLGLPVGWHLGRDPGRPAPRVPRAAGPPADVDYWLADIGDD